MSRRTYAAAASYGPSTSISAGRASHLMNPTSPTRNSFHPAALELPSTYLSSDESKAGQKFWDKSSGTQMGWNNMEDLPLEQRMPIRPSYLKDSKYLERLDAQFKARTANLKQMNTPTMSRSASGTSLHRMQPSYRGMTYEIVENIPPEREDESTPPLPSKWIDKDKHGTIDVSSSGLEIKWTGQTTTKGHDFEGAGTRSDHPMSKRCGIYYYEIKITFKHKDGAIAIGFNTPKAMLDKIAGWESESWAYHSDDGKLYANGGPGKIYGQPFSYNDIVGCGVNFSIGKAFFTKNGVLLGNAPIPDLKEILCHKKIYPSIGMKRPGGSVRVNFGQADFIYDIDEHVRNYCKVIQKDIHTRDIGKISPGHYNARELTSELVLQYLRHDGFVKTADSFNQEVSDEANRLAQSPLSLPLRRSENDVHAVRRQRIRSAILSGNIDEAILLTEQFYPNVLLDHPTILFRLKCRKFIEMMRLPTLSSTNDAAQTPRKAKARASKESIQQPNGSTELDQLGAALSYAKQLSEEYKTDDSPEVSRALKEIFALFAYADPVNSPAAAMIDVNGRLAVVEGLNSAILESLGAPSTTALELIYQQTQGLLDDCVDNGGSGALINIDKNTERKTQRHDEDIEMTTQ